MDWPPNTDPFTPRWERPNQLYGPRFISNLHGLVLEISSDTSEDVVSSKFSGERTQQWIFQPTEVAGNVSLVSLHDGRYLSVHSNGRVVVTQTPCSEWFASPDAVGRYSICTPIGHKPQLSLPTPPGPCSVVPSWTATEAQAKLIFLANTDENRKALQTGSIGRFANPEASVYYTYASAGRVVVRNHLDSKLFGAVSGSGGSSLWQIGSGGNSQWIIEPGKEVVWYRSEDCLVHISTPISDTGEQSAQVYTGHAGMTLHIQNLGGQETWRGIRSVTVESAKYTENPARPTSIGIQNDLEFDIFVSVFSTVQPNAVPVPGQDDGKPYRIAPKGVAHWSRSFPESVFVGVGSAPGLPQAYMGRPGFILHIEDWRPTGTH